MSAFIVASIDNTEESDLLYFRLTLLHQTQLTQLSKVSDGLYKSKVNQSNYS